MVTDNQIRRLLMLNQENSVAIAAAKSGMCENTARKYINSGKLPSQSMAERNWKTRKDPFEDVFPEVEQMLKINSGLETKTIFDYLQRKYEGGFQDGQLRTLQRKVKNWKALEGPTKEVFFPQKHYPGQLAQSDFTHMSSLGITISGQPFDHLLYHFVLTYSNWESITICFSESYESLSEGLQNALWELGKIPVAHRTDCLSAAVNDTVFTNRYTALLKHYGIKGEKTNPASPNENGDVEQSHYRLKKALDQALMLRGSYDFQSREEYQLFLKDLVKQLNSGRKDRFLEELEVMKKLPIKRLDDCTRLEIRVTPSSTIRVANNVYSVDSRLIKEKVNVRLYAEYLELWYNQKLIDTIPRIRGTNKHLIQYRHLIDSLIRKPGAFHNYRYRSDLFPTSRFRIAYDELKILKPTKADKEYLLILSLAAKDSEEKVDAALRILIEQEKTISLEAIKEIVKSNQPVTKITEIKIAKVDLQEYDYLLEAVYA